MASSAALMQGLQSFDSSDAGAESRIGGGITAGGITLGSVAPSFHSEDEDDEQAGGARWQQSKGKGREPYAEEESSILDEEEMTGAGGDSGTGDEEGYNMLPPQQTRPAPVAPPAAAARPASLSSRPASSASRYPSASTQATTAPSPQPRRPLPSSLVDLGHHGNSRLEDSDERDREQSGMLKELNMDESRDSGRWSGAKGANGAGKKKGGVGQNMTLREQEKVIDEFKKENFDLKLKIHFYEQRLERLAPDQIDLALRENIQLKVEFQTLRTELKRYKKLLLEGNRAIENLTRERDSALRSGGGGGAGGGKRERELEKELLRSRDQGEREREDREQLELRVKEQARELKELRDSIKRRRVDEWDGEDARAEISRLRSELDAERDAREDALGEADDLRNELRSTQDMLDEAQDGLARAREGDDSSAFGDRSGRGGGKRDVERLERKLGDLEQDNTSLRSQITAQVTMLSARNDEKDALREEVETLKHDLFRMEEEVEQLQRNSDRSQRRGSEGSEKTREELEEELGEHRDRASRHALQLEELESQLAEKEREIEDLLAEVDQRDADHQAALDENDEKWKATVEEAQDREAEAREILEEKEGDVEELATKIEALMAELAKKEAEMVADAEEVDLLTEDLTKLGALVTTLEEEAFEKDERIKGLETDLDAVDKELEDKQSLHEQVVVSFKEKLSTTKSRLGEINIQHESSLTENKFLREKVEELALRTAELEEKSRADLEAKRRLEDEAVEIMRALRKEEEERDLDRQEWNRQRRDEEHKWQRSLDTATKDAAQAQTEVAHIKSLLSVRESDLQSLQDALNGLEASSRRRGEESTNDRFALELELDRTKRDLARCQEDLERLATELEEKNKAVREKEMEVATLHSENKDLATQLAAQTQTRLSLTDKYDSTSKSLRDTQDELSAARDRLRVVEDQLNTDHRALSRTENQYRDQLTERNTLLLTIYQYMDKMVVSAPRKPGHPEPKPFANFSVFHDSLISRLKGVNQIQLTFERRTKEIESKFGDQFSALKRQQDSRLKQLDRFEAAIKAATETQRQWRQRVNTKQTEVDSAKALNNDLQAQVASLRATSSADPSTAAKLSVLSTRASTAERRLAATQAQLASAEEKLGDARKKVGVAEGKWEARLRELEARLRAAEEKVKRERQGAKERVAELGDTIRTLEGQVTGARRRDHQLGEVLTETERNRAAAGSRP